MPCTSNPGAVGSLRTKGIPTPGKLRHKTEGPTPSMINRKAMSQTGIKPKDHGSHLPSPSRLGRQPQRRDKKNEGAPAPSPLDQLP